MAVSIVGPKFYAWDANGDPLAFGKVYTYQAGTNTPKASYTTGAGDVEHTNPVILNGSGYAEIHLDGNYFIVLKDVDDNEIWTSDDVPGSHADEWVNCVSATYDSAVSFTAPGDLTSTYDEGRRVRINNNTVNYSYSTIDTVTFSGGITTVTITDSVVAVGVIGACVSIVGAESFGNLNSLHFPTLIDAAASNLISDGDIISLGERIAGNNNGKSFWDVVLTSTVTPNTFDVVISTADAALSLVLRVREFSTVYDYGAEDDENITPQISAMIDRQNRFVVPLGGSFYGLNIECKDDTVGVIDGKLSLPDASDHWDRILTNVDRVNGNKSIKIIGKGELNGNKDNQTKIGQSLWLFMYCSDCEVSVKKIGNAFGPDPYTGPAPGNHPDGPFNLGVPFGEASLTNPHYSAGMFYGGHHNRVNDFKLVDWGREGVYHWYSVDSTIYDFTAVNGPETDNKYYTDVDHNSVVTSATVSVGDQVHVEADHSAGGQPYLIYKAIASGTLNLSTEDYSDGARWSLVERDITLDYGYTAARISGANNPRGIINNGMASFCRASSFSIDSVSSIMDNLISYHNSYQSGINFGHSGSPGSSCRGGGLIAINSGWKGGTGGSSYGISVVNGSKDVNISDFFIIGAGKHGINISADGDNANLVNGKIGYSGVDGLNCFGGNAKATNVLSSNNAGDDFKVSSSGNTLAMSNCEDSDGLISNSVLDSDLTVRTFTRSRYTKLYTAFRGIFGVTAGDPIAQIDFNDTLSTDAATVKLRYLERNTGTSVSASQYATEEIYLVNGSGGSRNTLRLSQTFNINRGFRLAWDSVNGILNVYLEDGTPADVNANAIQNSMFCEIQSAAFEKIDISIG